MDRSSRCGGDSGAPPGLAVGGDTHVFVDAGRTLLSPQWDRAFASPVVQAGPIQLALFGSVGHWHGALALVLTTGTALLVVAAARAAGVKSSLLLGGVGLVAVLTGLTGVGLGGHPADAVIHWSGSAPLPRLAAVMLGGRRFS